MGWPAKVWGCGPFFSVAVACLAWAHLLMYGKCSSIHGSAVLDDLRKAYRGAQPQTRETPVPRSGVTSVCCSGMAITMLRIWEKILAVDIEVALTTRSSTNSVKNC